ncbi:uncharacterized protein BP5553_10018 [Venustampulla echinocandica]|uniref:Family A G protein-coupled receptor-like protein n=1 Tax=Venustampulla echinocandica TaxID=2656787 RepID=A0A370TA28_9HELO|nr:uncharacterized protein BP5553_10018 [Venustampulla echinocandica]RDL30673.1 hypothetical protein BP5553_10018 [Venustampulla echinocandica]
MAPFLPFAMGEDQPQIQLHIEARSLGNTTNSSLQLTNAEGTILQTLALVFAALSVASSILAFYWFVKMRRSFRHDLIMLLIQSDMFKALWFMIYPIVAFSQSSLSSNPTFCLVNGFLVSLGIEASDFAVLQIAIHTALYIFKPGKATGEGGLYPYRYISYVLWIVFPLLMASLAFVNGNRAYITEGTYCYLPIRPFWYQLALSWIPRYIIFIVIFVIYVSIYYYVRNKFQGFDKAAREEPIENRHSLDSVKGKLKPPKRSSLPPTPPLFCHGLIPESVNESRYGNGGRDLVTTTDAHRFMWVSFISKDNPHPPAFSSELVNSYADPFRDPPQPSMLTPAKHSSTMPASSPFNSSARSSLAAPTPSRAPSSRDNVLRRSTLDASGSPLTPDASSIHGNSGSSDTSTPGSQLQLFNSRGQNLIDLEMLHTRDKIRRQLRFLFIYPLVYMLMWIIPFVSHVLQYDDRFATNHPFALICANTIFICSQAAVDCWLFSTREKPWRHIPGTDGSFWGSLKFWSGWKGVGKRRSVHHGPGRTREEMVREARQAYQRRDEELAERKVTAVSRSNSITRKTDKDWWDAAKAGGLDDLGGMSPVAEEISNPMDAVQISENSSGGENGETGLEPEAGTRKTRHPSVASSSSSPNDVLSRTHET